MKYYFLEGEKVLFDYGKDNPLLLCHKGTWKGHEGGLRPCIIEGPIRAVFGRTRKGRLIVKVFPDKNAKFCLRLIEGSGDRNWNGWLRISTQYSKDLLTKGEFPQQIGYAKPDFPFALAVSARTHGGGCWHGWGIFLKKYVMPYGGLWLDLNKLEQEYPVLTEEAF